MSVNVKKLKDWAISSKISKIKENYNKWIGR
jgi:hypothetical protein